MFEVCVEEWGKSLDLLHKTRDTRLSVHNIIYLIIFNNIKTMGFTITH